MREKVYINGKEFIKWDIVEELRTKEAVIGYLTAVFEDHPTQDEVLHAVVIASKAIAAHGLVLEDNTPPAQSIRAPATALA